MPADTRIHTILDYLKKPKATRPRTLKTMSSHINAMFQKQLSASDVSTLIAALTQAGHITVTQDKISYNL